ncbi:MAG: outer membrane protein assembly factor BamC [Proteobacteria bacterium]|nr:outer membrane protein assembly factor BamC [Pseudomonadota bacterium]MDA1331378.1 outer membrane protein assembly factor BamC [Pseudomonadota bacterium]
MNFHYLQKLLLYFLIGILLVACDTISEKRNVDYKSAGVGSRTQSLAIPPELGSITQTDRYAIPGDEETTFSKYAQKKGLDGVVATTTLLPTVPDIRIGREGTYRWLIVDRPVEEIWPVIMEFWMMKGFLISDQSPVTGIIETDWAQENSKTVLTGLQAFLKNIFSSAYSPPERDKFWTRIERISEGEAEIYVSHQGMKKLTMVNSQTVFSGWEETPRDPNAEAKMLYELMLYLGLPEQTVVASGISNEAKPIATLVSIDNESGGYALLVSGPVQRVWGRIGIVLLTLGASLEKRDEARGLYFIRYQDPDGQVVKKGFERLKFWKDKKIVEPMVYQIKVSGDDENSAVTIQDENGQAVHNETEKRILLVLQERLG